MFLPHPNSLLKFLSDLIKKLGLGLNCFLHAAVVFGCVFDDMRQVLDVLFCEVRLVGRCVFILRPTVGDRKKTPKDTFM